VSLAPSPLPRPVSHSGLCARHAHRTSTSQLSLAVASQANSPAAVDQARCLLNFQFGTPDFGRCLGVCLHCRCLLKWVPWSVLGRCAVELVRYLAAKQFDQCDEQLIEFFSDGGDFGAVVAGEQQAGLVDGELGMAVGVGI
jgi:hypothetical protein